MTKVKDLVFTAIALLISATGINARPANQMNTQPLSVIYVGNEGGYLLFRVIVNTLQNISASFEISDRALGSIYSSNIDSPHKVEMLKIGKRNNQELDFKLVIGKDVYSRSFAIA
ncbi:MAG: hypothetical protein JWQ09_1314 [Segetibacter sp.]|nr:hypothetical protein [Segetibacter sp.]